MIEGKTRAYKNLARLMYDTSYKVSAAVALGDGVEVENLLVKVYHKMHQHSHRIRLETKDKAE